MWLVVEWTWFPDEEPYSEDPAQQLHCAAFLAACGSANLQLLDMSYTAHSQRVQQPRWGLGGLAARKAETPGVLLVPAARAFSAPTPQLVFEWPNLPDPAITAAGLTCTSPAPLDLRWMLVVFQAMLGRPTQPLWLA